MITKIDNTRKTGKQVGGFGIQILYPGTILNPTKDTGFGTIGRIDHASVSPGTLIPMHPHRDDEILTYLRSGKVKHKDSEGITDTISAKRMMLMNAGARFYHEELSLEEGGLLKGLQVFIRPAKSGLVPKVQFHDFPEAFSWNEWRAVAGSDQGFPLIFRSNTWLYDMRMEKGNRQKLPVLPIVNASSLLYVFEGEIEINNTLLKSGESIFLENEDPSFTSLTTTDLVLFVTDKNSEYSEIGMYSGNQLRK